MSRRALAAVRWTAAFVLLAALVLDGQYFFSATTTQRFHVGDVSTPASNITVQCFGSGITAAGNVHIRIPAGLDMQWNTGNNPGRSESEVGLVANPFPPSCYPGPKILRLDTLKATFVAAVDTFTVSNLAFTGFNSVCPPASLEMSLDDGVNYFIFDRNLQPVDPGNRTIRIAGFLSNAFSGNQTLAPGVTSGATTFSIQESNDATNGSIWASTDLRLTIPLIAGLPHVTWSGTPACGGNAVTNGRVAASPAFGLEDGGRTLRITVSSDFLASETVTISGLNFVCDSTTPDTAFQVGVRTGPANNATIHRFDSNVKTVVGLPVISSNANKVFTKGDPSTIVENITITNSPANPTKITFGNDIRIKIPAGFNAIWDTSVTNITVNPPAVGPSAAARVATLLLPYEDAGKTAVVNVTSDFSSAAGVGEGVLIGGLRFMNFSAPTGLLRLELESSGDTTSEDQDNRTIAIGAPTMSSSGLQVFQISPPGAALAPMATLTIVDDPTHQRIFNGTVIRINIPSTFNMTWQGSGTMTVGGPINVTPLPYENGNHTLVIQATGAFPPGGATISGLNFALSTLFSAPDNLELYMSATVAPANITNVDTQTIVIGGLPSISSFSSQVYTTNDPVAITTAPDITVTDAGGNPTISAAGDVRIRIPAGFNATWDTSVTVVGITWLSPGGPKVSTTLLPYEASGRTAVLNVLPVPTAPFVAGDSFRVSGLRYRIGAAASPAANLELQVSGAPIADLDNQTIAIGLPTISQPSSQIFGCNDPSTLYPTVTVTDDAANPRIKVATAVRIRIPAGINATWDTSITAPGITWIPMSASKVAPTLLPYEDGGKTAVVQVLADFANSDSFTVAGLRILPGNTETGPLPLELEVNNANSVANSTTTPQTLRTNFRPAILSATLQDVTGNGAIDRLVLTFSEPPDPLTSSALSGAGFTLAGYTLGGGTPGVPNANSITYVVAESGLPDSGNLPPLTYLPSAGDLLDLQGLETNSLGPIIPGDGSSPVIVGFSAVDTDGNGRLDSAVFTFSEALAPGQADINDWILIDANGTTNLLFGLSNANLLIVGSTVTITLSNADGSAGVPRYQYVDDGFAGALRDGATPTNLVPFLTNNTAPIANAGTNRTLVPTKVTLNGSGSNDPDGQPVTLFWSQIMGPLVTLSDATVAQPSFLPTAAGLYRFQLQVSDNLAVSFDTVDVTILNVPPVARTLFNQVQNAGGVNIYGFFSSDINGDPLTFSWAQVGNPPAPSVPPSSPFAVSTSIAPLVAGVYDYSLTVTDTAANTSTDRIQIRIHQGANMVPTAHAGPDQTIPVGSPVTLDGRLSSSPLPANGLIYEWTSSALLLPVAAPTLTFTPTLPGATVFTLVVRDAVTLVASAPATVTVNAFPANRPPVALALKLSPVTHPSVGTFVTLDATGSVDPEGGLLSYAWLQTAGPSVLLSNLSAVRPTFTAVAPGTYEFQLQVSDGSNWSLPAKVRFPLLPSPAYTPPSALTSLVTPALPNGHVSTTSSPIFLSAGVSGTLTDWWWEQTGGPAVILNTAMFGTFPIDDDPMFFSPPAAGLYSFRVTAGDFNTGVLATSTIDVVVDSPANNAPIAVAGPNQTGVAAGSTVTLDGSVSSDVAPGPVGPLIAFWTQLSGAPVTLTNPSSLQPTFVPPVGGVYVFQLVTSDGTAASGPSIVQVNVTGTVVGTGGGGGGGCGIGPEALLLLGLLRLLRRRSR